MADEQKALVATPAARDQTIEKLQDHYARNNLEVEEFERLVEMAERARTHDELMRVFDGLPSLEVTSGAPGSALVPAPSAIGLQASGRVTTTLTATFASTTRRGRWRVPGYVKVKARFGSVELDLTDAELTRGETVLDVSAVFGSITITVPEGLAVECEGDAVLGSFDHMASGPASRRDPRVVKIRGRAVFGSVDIVVKKRTGVLAEIKSSLRGLLGP